MIHLVLLSFSDLFLCFKVNPGADCVNTIVMAAASAVGKKLPPMIVFLRSVCSNDMVPRNSKNQ